MATRIAFGLRSGFAAFRQTLAIRPGILQSQPQYRTLQYLLTNQLPASSTLLSRSSAVHALKDQRRFKKGRGGRKETTQDDKSDDEEDDEDKEEDQEVVGTGAVDRIIDANSLRLDTVVKGASKWPRAKVEELFFDHRIRVNGERPTKKSAYVSREDEIDLIKGKNVDNLDFLDIFRFIVLDIPDISSSTGRVKLKVRVFGKMTVENYPKDPYEGSIINPAEEIDERRSKY